MMNNETLLEHPQSTATGIENTSVTPTLPANPASVFATNLAEMMTATNEAETLLERSDAMSLPVTTHPTPFLAIGEPVSDILSDTMLEVVEAVDEVELEVEAPVSTRPFTTVLNDPACERLCPDRNRLFEMLHVSPEFHPPHLDKMMPDIERVIASIAHQYTDQSCPHLHFDELVSQGLEKLARLITRGDLERLPTRKEFFKFFKTSVNNLVKGQVHKYRFTMKRTGVKPPPRGEINFESTKPVEISLDDPDAGIQISDNEFDPENTFKSDFYEELSMRLTPVEKMVFDQSIEANDEACFYAELDSYLGKKLSSNIKPVPKAVHCAQGLGMTLEYYSEINKSIRMKYEQMKQDEEQGEEVSQINFAIAALEQVFNLQIPRNLDKILVRRMLTISARAMHHKVDDEVAKLLKLVGATVPETQGNTLGCYGILYQRGHRICSACGLQSGCRAAAANVGLGDITIHPKLLGTKLTRIPALIQNKDTETDVVPPAAVATETIIADNADRPKETIVVATPRDEEILAYLKENFRSTKYTQELYFKHKDRPPSGKTKYIFWVGPGTGPLNVRFCCPTDSLKEHLVSRKNGAYLPANVQAAEAIKLIDQHAKESFK